MTSTDNDLQFSSQLVPPDKGDHPNPPSKASDLSISYGLYSQPVTSMSLHHTLISVAISRSKTMGAASQLEHHEKLETQGPLEIRKKVFEKLHTRLIAANLVAQEITPRTIFYCLPRLPNSCDPHLWGELLQRPYMSTDENMSKMLGLRRWAQHTPLYHDSRLMLYIRSFGFSLSEFSALVNELSTQVDMRAYDDKLSLWRNLCNDQEVRACATTRNIYLRYVGTTSRSPWIRHLEDLNLAPNSFVLKVIATLNVQFPHIIDNVTVWEVPDATVYDDIYVKKDTAKELTSIREQSLVSLMDTSSSLNTHAGGQAKTLIRTDAEVVHDIELMLGRSRPSQAFGSLLETCSAETRYGIAKYVDLVRETTPSAMATVDFPCGQARWQPSYRA